MCPFVLQGAFLSRFLFLEQVLLQRHLSCVSVSNSPNTFNILKFKLYCNTTINVSVSDIYLCCTIGMLQKNALLFISNN